MEKYDIIIIGGGMGGMTAANACAKRGLKTLVLEQNHPYRRQHVRLPAEKGFYFDGGDQSFESLGIVFPILDELGLLDKLRWHKARFRMVSPDFDFRVDSFQEVEEAPSGPAFPGGEGNTCTVPGGPGGLPLYREQDGSLEFPPLLHNFSISGLASMLPWLPKLRRWLTFDYRVKACSVIRDPWSAKMVHTRSAIIICPLSFSPGSGTSG